MKPLKNSMILYDMDYQNKKVLVICHGVPDRYYNNEEELDFDNVDLRQEIIRESTLSIVLDNKDYAQQFCDMLQTAIDENEWSERL